MRTAAALLHLIIIMMEALEIDAASGSSSTLPQLAGSSSKQQQRFNGNGNGNYAYASHDDDRYCMAAAIEGLKWLQLGSLADAGLGGSS